MISMTNLKRDQKGFTIIELLIATSILTVILLLVTVMISNIGSLYYKAIALSQTQGSTREITASVAQDVKLSDNAVASESITRVGVTVNSFCVGTIRYSYILGRQIGSDDSAPANQLPHILWRDARVGSDCTPVDITADIPASADGIELMSPRTRLTEFLIAAPTNPALITIKVGVAYGGEDLLSTTGPGAQCLGGKGDQYCATDTLTTTAVQRITAGF